MEMTIIVNFERMTERVSQKGLQKQTLQTDISETERYGYSYVCDNLYGRRCPR